MAVVKAKKPGVPVQSSLKGFVKRPAAGARQAAQPAKEENHAAVADPDLARALAASLAEPSQSALLGSEAESSARCAGSDDGRRVEESKGRTTRDMAHRIGR